MLEKENQIVSVAVNLPLKITSNWVLEQNILLRVLTKEVFTSPTFCHPRIHAAQYEISGFPLQSMEFFISNKWIQVNFSVIMIQKFDNLIFTTFMLNKWKAYRKLQAINFKNNEIQFKP